MATSAKLSVHVRHDSLQALASDLYPVVTATPVLDQVVGQSSLPVLIQADLVYDEVAGVGQ